MDTRFPRYALLAAVLFALLYRLFPIVTGQPALSQFFITEDGYLMLTIARNMAIGLGMTVSDGTIATNGVQPLATFLFTLPYLASGGDKVSSLIGIHLIMVAISVAGFFLVRAFARLVFAPRGPEPLLPLAAATLWFASPLLLLHSMNGLETGLQTVCVLLTLLQFARVIAAEREAGADVAAHLLLGLLCGLVFLSRNDAAFLVIAVFGLWFMHNLVRGGGFVATVARLLPPGLLCLVFAAPWMIYNKINFGSIVPISGTAQSLTAEFGGNAALIPAVLFEHLLPFLPIPSALETRPAVVAIAALVLVLVLGIFAVSLVRRGKPLVWLVVGAYAIYGIAVTVYYGLFFGAPHFMSRYLAPMAPLLIVTALWSLAVIAGWLSRRAQGALVTACVLTATALSVALLVRLVLPGVRVHEHFHVVRWVEQNVPAETWVGAVQTGTLGYWHNRTINLDGKVNPEALEARRTWGNVLRYIIGGRIEYIVDWNGVAGWGKLTEAGFDKVFEVIVDDSKANLAVLRRRAGQA